MSPKQKDRGKVAGGGVLGSVESAAGLERKVYPEAPRKTQDSKEN